MMRKFSNLFFSSPLAGEGRVRGRVRGRGRAFTPTLPFLVKWEE